MRRVMVLAVAVALGGCGLYLTPKQKVKRNLAKRGEILAEWTDTGGWEHVLVRRGQSLLDFHIKTYPYTEPELVGRVDPGKGRCTSILRTDGSGWTRRPGGRYRYERATRLNHLPSNCSEYRDTPAWPFVKAAVIGPQAAGN